MIDYALNLEFKGAAVPAQTQQDVINAWNNHASTFNFATLPLSSGTTMQNAYGGSSYSTACPAFMAAMGHDVSSILVPDPPGDDLVSAVLNDPKWYV